MTVLAVIRIITGILFLILGVLGLFLPILQGLLFLVIGFLLLSVDIPVFRRVSVWMQKKFPKLKRPVKRAREWLGMRRRRPPRK